MTSTTHCQRCGRSGFVGVDSGWCSDCESDYRNAQEFGADFDFEIERV